jgi:hypothetical protein
VCAKQDPIADESAAFGHVSAEAVQLFEHADVEAEIEI